MLGVNPVRKMPLDDRPRRILFLDIDGVLFLGVSSGDGLHRSDPFDKDCVEGLDFVFSKTNCEIVITSSWQNEYTLEQMKEIFAWNGVRATILDFSGLENSIVIPSNRARDRAREIQDWLAAKNADKTLRWCAVDDLDLGDALENFVRCDPYVGIKDPEVVSHVIKILTQ
jgi:hypothetical protein